MPHKRDYVVTTAEMVMNRSMVVEIGVASEMLDNATSTTMPRLDQRRNHRVRHWLPVGVAWWPLPAEAWPAWWFGAF